MTVHVPRDHMSRGTKKGASSWVPIPLAIWPLAFPYTLHILALFGSSRDQRLWCPSFQDSHTVCTHPSAKGIFREVVQISLDQEKKEREERGAWLQAGLETKGWDTAQLLGAPSFVRLLRALCSVTAAA